MQKYGNLSPPPHAPHGVHDCPEPYMVQGKPSPLPAPRLRQTGGRQAADRRRKASGSGSAPASGSERGASAPEGEPLARRGGGDFRLFTRPSFINSKKLNTCHWITYG